MKEMFILIQQEIDYTTVYGIYDEYVKAEQDYYNLKKYRVMYGELNIYKLDINKFYTNDDYEKVL